MLPPRFRIRRVQYTTVYRKDPEGLLRVSDLNSLSLLVHSTSVLTVLESIPDDVDKKIYRFAANIPISLRLSGESCHSIFRQPVRLYPSVVYPQSYCVWRKLHNNPTKRIIVSVNRAQLVRAVFSSLLAATTVVIRHVREHKCTEGVCRFPPPLCFRRYGKVIPQNSRQDRLCDKGARPSIAGIAHKVFVEFAGFMTRLPKL